MPNVYGNCVKCGMMLFPGKQLLKLMRGSYENWAGGIRVRGGRYFAHVDCLPEFSSEKASFPYACTICRRQIKYGDELVWVTKGMMPTFNPFRTNRVKEDMGVIKKRAVDSLSHETCWNARGPLKNLFRKRNVPAPGRIPAISRAKTAARKIASPMSFKSTGALGGSSTKASEPKREKRISGPSRLAEKLLMIRQSLDLSQNEMIRRLGVEDHYDMRSVSSYELGKQVPPLPVLLKYAQLAGVWAEVLVDDELDLPDKIPSMVRSEGVRHRTSSRGRIKQ